MIAASSEQLVVMWSSGREEPGRLAHVLAQAGAKVRLFGGDEEDSMIEACRAAPRTFVVLDGADLRASPLCARLRALENGDRITIAVVGALTDDTSGATAAILEAGADVVWPARVSGAVVAGAVRRAAVRADGDIAGSVIGAVTDALFILSSEGSIRSATVGVQAMLGHAPPALEGRALWELVDDDDAHLVRALISEAVRTRDLVAPSVVRARRHDGTFIEVELTVRCMLDDRGVRGLLVSACEASERMSVGAALQDAETRFGAIFENFLDGLVQIDVRSRAIVQVNPAFSRMTGYASEAISRLTLVDLFPEADRARASGILDAHFCGARSVSEAVCILHKNGTPLYVDLGTTRLELSGVPFVLVVVRDVTARRETERTRELFLAVVAHELRTPVAVLQNSVELLRGRCAAPSDDHDIIVDVIGEEVQRLTGLVADAVDLGAIQAGTFVVNPLRVELAPLVESVVERLASRFDGRPALRLEAVDAYLDPLRFQQIVEKLVDNAWRHGGAPDIEVTLTAMEGSARLDVVDHGPGLPPELRSTIFERVLSPNDRPTAGIGIGLWLAKRLACTMGGSIVARVGADGTGVGVTVTFPLSEDATRSA